MAYGPKFHLSQNCQKYDKFRTSQTQPIEKNNFGFHLPYPAYHHTACGMVSSCYICMVSSYLIPRLCYGELVLYICGKLLCNSQVVCDGELVLYIYGELLCDLQTCAMVSSCVITKLAWMQICAKLSSCEIATLARMHIYGMVSSCVIAKLARMQLGAKLSSSISAKLAWMQNYAGMNLCSRLSRRRSTDHVLK